MSLNKADFLLSNLKVWSDEIDGFLLMRDKMIIVNVLSELPKCVMYKVVENVLFIILCKSHGASVFQELELRKQYQKYENAEVDLILLNFALMDKDEYDKEKMRFIVAHEIAHIHLEHHIESVIPLERKEKEADDLAEEWGFKLFCR